MHHLICRQPKLSEYQDSDFLVVYWILKGRKQLGILHAELVCHIWIFIMRVSIRAVLIYEYSTHFPVRSCQLAFFKLKSVLCSGSWPIVLQAKRNLISSAHRHIDTLPLTFWRLYIRVSFVTPLFLRTYCHTAKWGLIYKHMPTKRWIYYFHNLIPPNSVN